MKHQHRHHRGAKWLPADPAAQATWLSDLLKKVETSGPLHPAVARFKTFLDTDAAAYMLFNQAFEQVKLKGRSKALADDPLILDVDTMLKLLSTILTRAPEFSRTGVVGTPIDAILDRVMATPAGYSAFLHDRVNAELRRVLNAWGRFLKTGKSRSVLNDDPRTGWFGQDAAEVIPDFDKTFVCDPAAPHKGFASWDDFFTRQYRDGIRPVAAPDDDAVIVNACESAPYRVAHKIKARDRFWIKSQPYSLKHMLADDVRADAFVGGSVYQAYLSALSYHRWHSPVTGTVVGTRRVAGTYFAELPVEGLDPAGPDDSQGYITHVATRAIVFIEADHPGLGLMAFLGVGMSEVSTCEITVRPGQRVAKGDQIGMFHFGGSTHCLLFRAGINLTFDLHGQKPGLKAKNIPVNARIATVA